MTQHTFTKVVYLPSYNCAKHVGRLLDELGHASGAASWKFLFVDNASTDDSVAVVQERLQSLGWQQRATVVRCKTNLGYSGSQKLAFSLIRDQFEGAGVVMLHADGQYPPEFVPKMFASLEAGADVVYGVRSRKAFGDLEETPLKVRTAMAALNKLESLMTGCAEIKEWHSGYVGYRTSFLRRINLQAITDTKHIDGNMLFAAHAVGARIEPLHIYKRYKKYDGFVGPEAYLYIWHCLSLMAQMPRTKSQLLVSETSGSFPSDNVDVVLNGSDGVLQTN